MICLLLGLGPHPHPLILSKRFRESVFSHMVHMVHTFFASHKPEEKETRDARRTTQRRKKKQPNPTKAGHTAQPKTARGRKNKKKSQSFFTFPFFPFNVTLHMQQNRKERKTTLLLRACVRACVHVRASVVAGTPTHTTLPRFDPFMICRYMRVKTIGKYDRLRTIKFCLADFRQT